MTTLFATHILQTHLAKQIESKRFSVYSRVDNNIFYTLMKIKFAIINNGDITIDILVDNSMVFNNINKYLDHLHKISNPFYIQIGDNVKKILEGNIRTIVSLLDDISIAITDNNKLSSDEIKDLLSDVPMMVYNNFNNFVPINNLKNIIIDKINNNTTNKIIKESKSVDEEIFVEILNKINGTQSRQMLQLYADRIITILDKYSDDYYINLLKITIDDNKKQYFKDYLSGDTSNDSDDSNDDSSELPSMNDGDDDSEDCDESTC